MKTEFTQKQPGAQWFWRTKAENGKIVADGSEGYNRLSGAVNGFLRSQGVIATETDVKLFQTKLVQRNDGTYQYTHATKNTEEETEEKGYN
jgi:uncharacterized protein YegP (UPF0339 family)